MSSLKDIPVITRICPCPRRSAATLTPCLLKPGEKKRHSINERAGFPVIGQKKTGGRGRPFRPARGLIKYYFASTMV